MSKHLLPYLLASTLCLLFFSCVGTAPTKEVHLIDSLNEVAYTVRYKNIDSSYRAAWKAYSKVQLYGLGKAEACNNLGFCAFIRMDFERAERLHKEVFNLTQNELELLIADIGLMRIYQRTAMNKPFYDYRNSALRRMKRIREDSNVFTEKHEKLRLNFALSEFYLVSAVYYYYLQQRDEAIVALNEVEKDDFIANDTDQELYYHYLRGSAALYEAATPAERTLKEFDELFTTYNTAVETGNRYFTGNGLQGLAEMMTSRHDFNWLLVHRSHYLDQFELPIDSLLPLHLAQKALGTFKGYNDLYQMAGTYVTIAKYLNEHERYQEALDTLKKALGCVNRHHLLHYHEKGSFSDRLFPYIPRDTLFTEMSWIKNNKVKTVPEWILEIREQLSVSYAGLGMKTQSDYNRNIYLDILNNTRQDKELENRYASYQEESKQLTVVLIAVVVGMILVFSLFWQLNKRAQQRSRFYIQRMKQILTICGDITASIPMNVPLIQREVDELIGEGKVKLIVPDEGKASFLRVHRLNRYEQALLEILVPYVEWARDNENTVSLLSDERLRIEKERYIYEQHIAAYKRQNIVKKACLAIVNGITPYIDRILNEVHKLNDKRFADNDEIRREKYRYIDELVTTINEYNDILSLWIKMRQGSLSLNIETFALNELFALIAKGRRSYEMKQQQLTVEPTDLFVKADKALTLFMINTLAENARKYTPEGGKIHISAKQEDNYVEVSVEDTGRGLSQEDIQHIIGEKVYNSGEIGMKDATDAGELKKNKGSGFGLMNCKGIIDKYKKVNRLFDVCLFSIESERGKGSRFFFRLPVGWRKTIELLLILLLPATFFSCKENTASGKQQESLSELRKDSDFNRMLQLASNYADTVYFSNVNRDYHRALHYARLAIQTLNKHYLRYTQKPLRTMQLTGEGQPAEVSWWNSMFDTDYYIILDVRNEAAVAFLALKQLDNYNYNNSAYTSLYKLQSEDQSLEGYCRQLQRSSTNKMVGILLCIVLVLALLVGYYFLFIRKRLMYRMNLEQVLEINKRVFSSSQLQLEGGTEALQREEDTLNEIPRQIVKAAFDSINELLAIDELGIAVFSESIHRLVFASNLNTNIPYKIVEDCFNSTRPCCDDNQQAFPLKVDVGNEHQCVGVLYLLRRKGTWQEGDSLLEELVARYVAIVVYNAVVKLAMKYRDIESASEETRRASREDSMLHVQNMVLDNCLSTIKHETVYYPNRIKQIVERLNSGNQDKVKEQEDVEAIDELIAYYKGIFTILSSCASRQLEEVTFKRSVLPVERLMKHLQKYFLKVAKNNPASIRLQVCPAHYTVVGDENQLFFLLENLVDAALAVPLDGVLDFSMAQDGEFVRFLFTDTRQEKSLDELNRLFYPDLKRMTAGQQGDSLSGTEYLICKQIIREHDEFAGKRGCRMNAQPADKGGFTVYFTLPEKDSRQNF